MTRSAGQHGLLVLRDRQHLHGTLLHQQVRLVWTGAREGRLAQGRLTGGHGRYGTPEARQGRAVVVVESLTVAGHNEWNTTQLAGGLELVRVA